MCTNLQFQKERTRLITTRVQSQPGPYNEFEAIEGLLTKPCCKRETVRECEERVNEEK